MGLVVEEEDERLGLALVMSVFDYTSSSVEELRARQARTRLYCTECESSVSFFLREKGVGLGSVFICTSSSVEELRARQARTRLYCTECESSVSFFLREKGVGLGQGCESRRQTFSSTTGTTFRDFGKVSALPRSQTLLG